MKKCLPLKLIICKFILVYIKNNRVKQIILNVEFAVYTLPLIINTDNNIID